MKKIINAQVWEFLEEKTVEYNQPRFIETDPIRIPHEFSKKEDIEIAGFLTASIAWGNRKSILKNAREMMGLLDWSPHEFVLNHTTKDLEKLKNFVHRTFNGIDFCFFIRALQNIYENHEGPENIFRKNASETSLQPAISKFKEIFFEIPHPSRTTKHISDPKKNSAAKRINMFLRWMVRKDNAGVDFGIWESLSPSLLSCPLDVHTGNTARKLGLITRKQTDAKALMELDTSLRKFDPQDPVKYDFALFGLGIFEKF